MFGEAAGDADRPHLIWPSAARACCLGIIVYGVLQITAHCSADQRKYPWSYYFNIFHKCCTKKNIEVDLLKKMYTLFKGQFQVDLMEKSKIY